MWTCAIAGCGTETDRAEDLLVHQATDHEHHECSVCGAVQPDGYFAIRHAFDEHSRAEYARAYEADTEDVRRREAVVQAIEDVADVEAVVAQLDAVDEPSA